MADIQTVFATKFITKDAKHANTLIKQLEKVVNDAYLRGDIKDQPKVKGRIVPMAKPKTFAFELSDLREDPPCPHCKKRDTIKMTTSIRDEEGDVRYWLAKCTHCGATGEIFND